MNPMFWPYYIIFAFKKDKIPGEQRDMHELNIFGHNPKAAESQNYE